MSSFITSDYTVLAIVEGMRKFGLIDKKKQDSLDMAEALRLVNEFMTNSRYSITEINHQEVTALPRDFADGEVLKACNCWLYQVDTGEPMDFDSLTIFEAVKKLKKTLIKECVAAKTLEIKLYLGDYYYFFFDEELDSFVNMDERYDWDLEETMKAA